ncbi:ATP-binding protein [Thalassotalea marina]|uniref:histidine kinase n=1 Tax=Thalassotalea marina TaxID=1673741 RepID=A0A919BCC6_9GAMM|nr:ATP-binding protein [Thalassotalea marina]GHF79168.1 hypothetical protein GCM10017161_02900 [Thalassotalea marina]
MKPRLTTEYQVVTRYTLSIFGVFIAIMLVSLMLASYRYYEELASFENSENKQLVHQAKILNKSLQQTVDSLTAIQSFASYYLNFADEQRVTLPKFNQDGDKYFLNFERRDIIEQRHHLSVNITGQGQFDQLDAQAQKELSMTFALTPAFISAQGVNGMAKWFYYVSMKQFVGIYPWIGRKHWQYSKSLINSEQIHKLARMNHDDSHVVWSQPQMSASANSLYTSASAGVYRDETFVGAAVINIDLAKLHDALSLDDSNSYHYVLLNERENVLLHKFRNSVAINSPLQWQQLAPPELSELRLFTGNNQPLSFKHNDYLVLQQTLNTTGWKLIKYKPYEDFVEPIFERFMWLFSLLSFGLLSLLSIIYFVTRKTFIKPTEAFISHIAYSAQGDHGKITAPIGWRQWFDIVGDIFSQNRSLLQQLRDQNNVLDMRVNEKTQALLEKSRQHQHDYAILRSVMNAIPDYLIFNDSNGHLIGCNLAFERFVNLAEVQMLGQKAGDLINNELGRALKQAISGDDVKESHHGIFKVVATVDNTYELFSSEFYNEERQILGTIVVIRDVTSQYAVNAALAKAKEQAELANQAKSQFLANMSHEIRTPINAIQGMHTLLDKTGLTSQQKQHISHAQDASDALLHLVDELLDLAKIESGNMKMVEDSCSLDQIINRAIKLNSDAIHAKNLALDVVIDAQVPALVLTDDMRLVQVVSNLLNNAAKFTHQGKISIKLDVIAKGGEETLVRFSVKDTGIGIAKNKQEKLFEAFMQADESMTREYGGSGLGLSICQRIINILGGEIKLKSDSGQGAEFSFVLPFIEPIEDDTNRFKESYQVISIGEQLPAPFIKLIENLHYQYLHIAELSDVNDINSELPSLVFVHTAQVNDRYCAIIANHVCQSMEQCSHCHLAIVQSKYDDSDSDKFMLLEQYNLPYTVCELPLYRYSLYQAITALSARRDVTIKGACSNSQSCSEVIAEQVTEDLTNIQVLLVEDNLVNQLVAKELLKALGAQVTVAENGKVAITLLEQQSFDVVLMDIQMPVMDGLSATKYIREKMSLTELPIIAMTAHARNEDRESSFEAGMNLHVAKPVKGDVLRDSILSVLVKKM